MKLFLLLAAGIFFSAPALACYLHEQKPHSVRQFCQKLPHHRPDASVAYQPGADVQGRAVMPADINTPVNSTLDPMQVPVTIDLAQRAGLGLPADTEMDAAVAMLDIYEDGRVLYNGQDISSNTRYLCETVDNEQPKPEKAKDSYHANP
ncbi:MAG: hypothetical protein ACT4OY_02210 [Alphaproteobacteria bacterium]